MIERLVEDIGGCLLDTTEDQLLAWQDRQRARLAVKSVYVYTSHVREFFAWLQSSGRREDNPAADLMLPRVHRGQPRPIPTADLVSAIVCAPEPVRTWLIVMALCGLRCCDLAWLQRDCLRGASLHFETKGGKWRSVPCPEQARAVLRPLLFRPGQVFVRATGRPFHPDTISSMTRRYLLSIGLDYGAHSVRHWFGTEVHRRTKNLPLTRDLMGHEDISSTVVYTDVGGVEGHDALSAMGGDLAALLQADLAEPAGPRLGETAGDEPRRGAA